MISAENESQNFTVRVLIICAGAALIILSVLAVIYVFDVVLLLFGAILLAIFLHGLATVARRYLRLSEGKSVLLVSLILAAISVLCVWLLAPNVAEQVTILRADLPVSAQKAGAYLSQFGWGKTIIEQMPSADEVLTNIDAATFLTRVGNYFSTTAGIIANVLLLILLAVYLASEPKLYIRGFTKLFPQERRERVSEILLKIGETLQWWLVGKGASMLFIGVLTWIGLYFIGVPLSLTLGLIAGLFSFVPNFGPILSAVPAILLAFIDSPAKALYVLILFVVVQLIESNLLTPMIERRTVELPPVLTITAQLALSILIGGAGLILATPILAVVMVLIQTIYIQDILGDRKEITAENEEES